MAEQPIEGTVTVEIVTIPAGWRDALRAALWSTLFSFVILFLLTAMGWLQDVYLWASTSGAEPLPGLSVLGYGLIAAGVSALIGFINFVYRWLQSMGVRLPGSAPAYTPSVLPPLDADSG